MIGSILLSLFFAMPIVRHDTDIVMTTKRGDEVRYTEDKKVLIYKNYPTGSKHAVIIPKDLINLSLQQAQKIISSRFPLDAFWAIRPSTETVDTAKIRALLTDVLVTTIFGKTQFDSLVLANFINDRYYFYLLGKSRFSSTDTIQHLLVGVQFYRTIHEINKKYFFPGLPFLSIMINYSPKDLEIKSILFYNIVLSGESSGSSFTLMAPAAENNAFCAYINYGDYGLSETLIWRHYWYQNYYINSSGYVELMK